MSMVTLEYLSGVLMRTVRVQVILPHDEMHPDRATLVGGFSMGGFGALMLGMKN